MKYASGTSVSVNKSIAEIQSTLTRYGADQFRMTQDTRNGYASIEFSLSMNLEGDAERVVLEQVTAGYFELLGARPVAALAAWEQGCRQRWRALHLSIKSKLESVESGIEAFDHAFMAQILLPDGSIVGEHIARQISEAYAVGINGTPALLGLPAPR